MTSYPRRGLLAAKETIAFHQNASRSEAGLKLEYDRVCEIMRSRDCAEGIDAFKSKRPPVYQPGTPVHRPGREFDPGRDYGRDKSRR
jgi:hypothetical protein